MEARFKPVGDNQVPYLGARKAQLIVSSNNVLPMRRGHLEKLTKVIVNQKASAGTCHYKDMRDLAPRGTTEHRPE